MHGQPLVPDRQPPGPWPGSVVGVAAGLLLAWIWLFGDWDVALAVTAVLCGLIAVLLGGVPDWRPFATGMLASAATVVALLLALAWWATTL